MRLINIIALSIPYRSLYSLFNSIINLGLLLPASIWEIINLSLFFFLSSLPRVVFLLINFLARIPFPSFACFASFLACFASLSSLIFSLSSLVGLPTGLRSFLKIPLSFLSFRTFLICSSSSWISCCCLGVEAPDRAVKPDISLFFKNKSFNKTSSNSFNLCSSSDFETEVSMISF